MVETTLHNRAMKTSLLVMLLAVILAGCSQKKDDWQPAAKKWESASGSWQSAFTRMENSAKEAQSLAFAWREEYMKARKECREEQSNQWNIVRGILLQCTTNGQSFISAGKLWTVHSYGDYVELRCPFTD